MTWHHVVHYLDLLRHEAISTFAWEAVKTNIGAWPWQAALTAIIGYALWPKLRTVVNGWVEGNLAFHQEQIRKLLAEHHEAVKEHVANEIAKITNKETR